MPGNVLHMGAVVMCSHGGQAQPTASNPRVTVSGQAVVCIGPPYVVAGCPFVPPAPGPCVTGQFIMGATRVTAGGQPVLIWPASTMCVPTGTPLMVVSVQARVQAQ